MSTIGCLPDKSLSNSEEALDDQLQHDLPFRHQSFSFSSCPAACSVTVFTNWPCCEDGALHKLSNLEFPLKTHLLNF